jgi:hypothetical protein
VVCWEWCGISNPNDLKINRKTAEDDEERETVAAEEGSRNEVRHHQNSLITSFTQSDQLQ